MGLLEALVLGLVQGLTEFLPISSTAHVRLIPVAMGWSDPGAPFTAVIQLGTLLAVLIYFWADLVRASRGWWRGVRGEPSEESRMGWAILIGTIPIVVLGMVLKDSIEGSWRSLQVIAWSLILMGIVMLLAERLGKKLRARSDITPRDGLFIGLWQALSLVPGASRSGSTISGALFAGFEREAAARISFLLSVPAIFGAAVFSLMEHADVFSGPMLWPAVVANVAAFGSGYAAIAFLIKFLQTRSMNVFVAYRVALGVIILALLQTGALAPLQGLSP